jgi:hypothetical protein
VARVRKSNAGYTARPAGKNVRFRVENKPAVKCIDGELFKPWDPMNIHVVR